jgi:glycosyltransferase involved in cell wall biosynthesis
MRTEISIITPNFSSNALGRAYVLARVLQKRFGVEIVGPMLGSDIWKPLASQQHVKYRPVRMGSPPGSYFRLLEIRQHLHGDVIYASKPLLTSFGVGLLEKLFEGRPLVLDIDDWQVGFIKEYGNQMPWTSLLRFAGSSLVRLYDSDSIVNVYACDRLVGFSDGITVASTFLQEKFGGTLVWHGRDTTFMDPKKFPAEESRDAYGVGDEKVVMFFGTPRPHKGVEDVIRAMHALKRDDAVLIIGGIDRADAYSRRISRLAESLLGKRFKGFPPQPFDKIPRFLAMADVVVVPQRATPSSIGQVPAKVFDAMAMEKPIIATRVSDLPSILEGAGWIVEPSDIASMAKAIAEILNDPDGAARVARKARRKCVEDYSWKAMERVLVRVFSKFC